MNDTQKVEEWIVAHCDHVSDYSKKLWIDTDTIRTYIAKLTAAHAAELAEAEAKGRREALMRMPVDALIYATLLLRLEAGNIESVVSSKTVSTYNRQISRLIESVRGEQAINNQTVPVPAEALIAILGRLTPDGRFEVRHRGVEPEILADLYYQAKRLLRNKVEDDDGAWDTACGNRYQIIEGTPEQNDMQFCIYCGGKLVQQLKEEITK